MRSTDLLASELSRLIIVDMQERLLAAIPRPEQIVARCRMLLQAAALFGVPVDLSEQYPKGLGRTVEPLRELTPAPLEKLRFSASDVLAWAQGETPDFSRPQIVIAGIELHVCVLQTSLDLVARGYRVYVAVDASGSRHEPDRELAIRRLADSGVLLTSVESVLFEWCESAEHVAFKALSRIVTGRPAS